jgi:hypothetical protein
MRSGISGSLQIHLGDEQVADVKRKGYHRQ